MLTRDELHDLVDRLGDDQAAEALAYLSGLLNQGEAPDAAARLGQRMGPRLVDGGTFHSQG